MFEKPARVTGENYNSVFIIYCIITALPVLCLLLCAWLDGYLSTPEHKFAGFVNISDKTYDIFRIAMWVVSVYYSAYIIGTKIAIEKRSIFIFSRMYLNTLIRSDELTVKTLRVFYAMITMFCANISMYGMTIFIFGGNKQDSYPLIFVGFIFCLLFMPNNDFVNKLIDLREKEREKSKCPACGKYMPVKAKFCGNCGKERVKA